HSRYVSGWLGYGPRIEENIGVRGSTLMNEASVIRPEDLQSGVLGKPAAVRPSTQSRQMPAVPLAYAVTVLIVWLNFLRPFEWLRIIQGIPAGYMLGVCSITALAMYYSGGRSV